MDNPDWVEYKTFKGKIIIPYSNLDSTIRKNRFKGTTNPLKIPQYVLDELISQTDQFTKRTNIPLEDILTLKQTANIIAKSENSSVESSDLWGIPKNGFPCQIQNQKEYAYWDYSGGLLMPKDDTIFYYSLDNKKMGPYFFIQGAVDELITILKENKIKIGIPKTPQLRKYTPKTNNKTNTPNPNISDQERDKNNPYPIIFCWKEIVVYVETNNQEIRSPYDESHDSPIIRFVTKGKPADYSEKGLAHKYMLGRFKQGPKGYAVAFFQRNTAYGEGGKEDISQYFNNYPTIELESLEDKKIFCKPSRQFLNLRSNRVIDTRSSKPEWIDKLLDLYKKKRTKLYSKQLEPIS